MVKKKMNARQLREARAQEMSQKFKQQNIGAEISQPQQPDNASNNNEAKAEKEYKEKKSTAKMAGLKSMFILSDKELLMTSFGRGNDAVIEKYVKNDEIKDLNEKPSFEAQNKGVLFSLQGRKSGTADNPLHMNGDNGKSDFVKVPGMDMIGIKEKLEKQVFNTKTSFEDNIHIQLAYNILDIEKILAPVLNNIVYEIQNLTRDAREEDFDLIGQMSLKNSYGVFSDPDPASFKETAHYDNVIKCKNKFEKIIAMPQRMYMGDALYYPTGKIIATKPRVKREEREEDYKRYYYEISLIASARQMLFHGSKTTMKAIYKLDSRFDKDNAANPDLLLSRKEARDTLDFIYSRRVGILNQDFIDLAKKDLAILFNVYEADTVEEKKALVQEYYDFIVKKDHKNIGFSLKKLREMILETDEGKAIKADCERSMWSKFVKNFDFISQHYYSSNPDRALQMVDKLRSSENDDEQEAIYTEEANFLWKEVRPIVTEHLLENMKTDTFKKITADKDVTADMLKEVSIPSTATCFSELIYLFTLFLNGKEINDLLTQLINKFESIESFNYVLKQQGLCTEYTDNFKLFADSAQIARELRNINSFARMQKDDPDAKKALFVEAAQVLGFNGDEDDLDEYVELMLTKDEEKKKEIIDAFRKKNSRLPLPNKGFRNFIANNVVESTKFKYLVRYTNPEMIPKLMHNEKVIKFMLQNIPDEQIKRYYVSCIENAEASAEAMRDSLRRELKGISFDAFATVNQSANSENDEDKMHKQGIIGLYLAVAYLLIKNIVYINSRYSIAFHCLERDRDLLSEDYTKDYLYLTQKFIDEKRLNKKSRDYLCQNIQNTDTTLIHWYRNNADHMNVLRYLGDFIGDIQQIDSYYSLYHYIMQRCLIRGCENDESVRVSPTIEGYFDTIKTYHRYRKDFVKALNVPFGYNLARYKNLSIEGLFDMHNVGNSDTISANGD